MAPKPTRNSRVPISTVLGAHAIDHSSGYEQPRRKYPNSEHIVSASTDGTTPPTKQGGGTTSARNSSGHDDEEAGVDGTGSTKADDEDNEDSDGDALAPSDAAMEGHGDQAGPINVNDANEDEGDSDDEAYNGIDLISDSEGEDSDLMQEEERNIIESEGDDFQLMPAATIPTSPTEASDEWAGFDVEHGFFSTDISHFDEQYGRSDHSMFESEFEMRRATGVFDDFDPVTLASRSPSPPLQPLRRVRFQDPVSYPSDGSDIVSDDGGLDGLFNSAFAQIGEDFLFDEQVDDEDDDGGSSVGNSSGYETDYGDTTDEEDVPASATTRPQSLLRQPSLSSMDNGSQMASPAAPGPFKVPATPLRHRRGPRMGSWTVDRTKPFAIIDSTGDNMVIVPAKRPARGGDCSISSTANTSPTTSQPWLASAIDENGIDYSDFSLHDDPMLASEPDVMPSTLPLTAPSSQIQDQAFVSSSDFFPMDAIGDVNAVYAVDDQDDDGDDDEGMLNVNDFIDFGVSTDDEVDRDQELLENPSLPSPASTSPLGTGANSQYKTPSSSRNSAQHLLKHLDKGVISAFRRGQPHHQAQLRRPQSGSSLNSQAFKGGRHAAAHTSLSSQKKRKLSDTFGGRPSFGVGTKKRLLNRR